MERMNIHFYKYQGTGNDFVMLDNRNGIYDFVGVNEIKKICDRRFGVGADGLIKINAHRSQEEHEKKRYTSPKAK